MFTYREIQRFGLRYYGIFYQHTLITTAMSEVGAKQQITRLERKVTHMRRDKLPL